MIKLIACDMDGTLLTSDKRLPPDLFDVLARLRRQGVAFAVASGRQYGSLRRDFEALVPHMIFICENGALIMDKDRQLFLDPIDPARSAYVNGFTLPPSGIRATYTSTTGKD